MTRLSTNLTLAYSCLAHAYTHMFILLYATVVLVLEREWGLTFSELQWLSVPGFVMFGVAALPAGWLGDKWSSPGMMAVMFIGLGVASFVVGLAEGTTGILVGLTLIGTFAAIYHPVGIPWLMKNAENPSRSLGLNGVFGSGGTAIAAITAGALADYWTWRAAFMVPGTISFITGVAFLWSMKVGHIVEAEQDRKPQPQSSAGDMKRAFMVLAFTVVCTGMIFQSTSVSLPKIFDERLTSWLTGDGGEISAIGIGGFVSIAYACAAFAQIIGGELAERYNLKWVYLLSQLVQVPILLLAWASHSPVLIVLAALMVSMNVLGQPAENTLLGRYTPLAWRARVFGAKFVLTLGISSLGVMMVPVLHKMNGNLDFLFFIMAGFAGTAGLIAMLLPSHKQSPVQVAEPAE
ncbi:MAG: MFS transporter [Alphaproteobacteria bacterium]|jgi:MFS transporter, FSR family, fosmidomycin resistance protein|nr:MFS transporter [Alphaproteobacteria bacterium]MBT4084304.1 MFS transporter [Alphaproteobacteria bacterium]MBT4545817.1 MFS transporter [Alphaproteobacteria bacterium]MBT5918116.1 MFS transporter [Alphaproteobacteria bacterium]MBT6386707.1 MFS transporter [Alphaproteobacteria bacterium]